MKALFAIALAAVAGAGAGGAAPPTELTVVSARGERTVPVIAERGFPAVALAPLGAVLTLASTGSRTHTMALRAADRQFEFVLDSGYFRFGERVYTVGTGPYVARDSVFLPLQFLTETLPRLMSWRFRYDPARARLEELSEPSIVVSQPAPTPVRPAAAAPGRRRRIVAIDPGHGGVDPGMSGPIGRRPTLTEKTVTFGIARHLSRELESRGHGTLLTRTRDTLIHRSHRGGIAGRAGADIFVSIHVNAADPAWRNAASARGFETYYLGDALTEDARRVSRMEESVVRFETSIHAESGDPLSRILADLAQNEHLRESSRLAQLVHTSIGRVHPSESRGVKQAPFTVLHTSYMPAILIETGFGSNQSEARYLTSDAGQRRLARAIAEGIGQYLAEYERRLAAQ